MRLYPEGFTTGLRKVASKFAIGVWEGMGPKLQKKVPRRVSKRRKRS